MNYEKIPDLRAILKVRQIHGNEAVERVANDLRTILKSTGSPFALILIKKTKVEGHLEPHRSVAVGFVMERTLYASDPSLSPIFNMDEIPEMSEGVTSWTLLQSSIDLDLTYGAKNPGKIRFKVASGFHDDPARMLASTVMHDPYFMLDVQSLNPGGGLFLLRLNEEDETRLTMVQLVVD